MANWTIRRVQAFASLNGAKRYLEIGIENGHTFNAIDIPHKTGVDINLDKFQPNLANVDEETHLYEQSSDDFFRNTASGVYDLIFLDGLHTADQTFRDFVSTLNFAGPSTIWLIDDVLPVSPLSSVSDLEQWHKLRKLLSSDEWQWHGDVFRSILLMRASLVGFNFATIIDGPNAQTVIWRGKNAPVTLKLGWEQISRYSFFDLIQDLSVLNVCSEVEAVNAVRTSLPRQF
jgi:hypothetical protein